MQSMYASGQKAVQGEGCIETARSGKGEQEPANRGTNNEDKTKDGGMPGLQMMIGVFHRKEEG